MTDYPMTKGDVLLKLKFKSPLFKVPDLIVFSCHDWEINSSGLIKKILLELKSNTLVVRSSAQGEDGDDHSMAGEFDSVLNVKRKEKEIRTAVNQVINSYHNKNKYDNQNKIIVQTQITNVLMSGVIFTREMNTGSPYYVINYDDKSGLTNSVTSGMGEYSNRTIYILRNTSKDEIKSKRFKILIEAIRNLEIILSSDLLDIEFALNENLEPFIFQVRNITSKKSWNLNNDRLVYEALESSSSLFFKQYLKKEKSILGDYSILSQMSDWNPVEMIGKCPNRLDFSLYNILITKYSWSEARHLMGYHHAIGSPLMVSISGQPYIDTRLSFNSFLPKKLNKKIGEKLVNYWIKKLKHNPFLHDKIEFDIAITCYSFKLKEVLVKEYSTFLTNEEINEVYIIYKKFTIDQFNNQSKGSIKNALLKINQLNNLLKIKYSKLESLKVDELNKLIKLTINLGIIPFSIIARHAFISKTLLDSLNDRYKLFSKEDLQKHNESIPTVASDFNRDSYLFSKNKIDSKDFFSKYGHLRPGTYDITSLRYDQMDQELFKKFNKEVSMTRNYKMNLLQKEKIDSILVNHGFEGINCNQFMSYVSSAIKNREYAKFIFSKGISIILEIIANEYSKLGFSRAEISNLSIDEIIQFHQKSKENNFISNIYKLTKRRKEKVILSHSLRLPQVITNSSDFKIIPFQVSQPNFITNKSIQSRIFHLDTINDLADIRGKIVLLENADPGYDFIFNYQIKGLITKFGGANSHMAIRCAEFNLPAAIGCGEQIFESLNDYSGNIKLDCIKNQIIKII